MTGRILVTGGAGFIGSHLTDFLVAQGRAVTVLDDFSTGEARNLDEARAAGDVRIVTGSVLDRAALDEALTGCGMVFHLAVQCVRRSLRHPIQNHEINATGTLMTLEAAKAAGIERFIYCSSSEVYGNSGEELLDEERTHCAPVTIYGAAKLAGELYAKAYHQTYQLPTVIVRPFNAYGPREHEQGDLAEVIPRFVIRLLNGLPPVIFGDGSNGRDFTYVADVARGLALAGGCDTMIGKTVNIARGAMISIADVARTLAVLCDRPEIEASHIEPRPGDVLKLRADTGRARRILGYQPEIDFAEGAARYVKWFRASHNNVASLLEENPRNW